MSASIMPTSDQVHDDIADPLAVGEDELQRWAEFYHRTNSDKSNLGIPAEDNSGWVLEPEQSPSADVPSVGQVSCSQGSWDTVSATSHGTSRSFQNPSYGQHLHPEGGYFAEASNALSRMVNVSSSHTLNEANSLYTMSSPDPTMAESRFRTPKPKIFTPDPSSTDGEVPLPSDWMDFINQIDVNIDFGNNASRMTGDLEPLHPNTSMEVLSPHQHPDQLLEGMTLAGPIRRPIMEIPETNQVLSTLTTSYLEVPRVGSHSPRLKESGQVGAGQQPHKKRKRLAPHKRDNVDKINSVRKVGACIRCAVLHEKVSWLVSLVCIS